MATMRSAPFLAVALCSLALCQTPKSDLPASDSDSSACDFDSFVSRVLETREVRRKQLLTEAEFAELSKRSKTVVLDARHEQHHAEMRIKGSLNLPYTVFSARRLEKEIPDKSTRILIYCRNNFSLPESDNTNPTDLDVGWAKGQSVGLNIPTFVTLREYGYTNVWELNEVIDPRNCQLEIEFNPFSTHASDTVKKNSSP